MAAFRKLSAIAAGPPTAIGSTHLLTRMLTHVGTEMSLHVLAYNLKRVMRMLWVGGLLAAMKAVEA